MTDCALLSALNVSAGAAASNACPAGEANCAGVNPYTTETGFEPN